MFGYFERFIDQLNVSYKAFREWGLTKGNNPLTLGIYILYSLNEKKKHAMIKLLYVIILKGNWTLFIIYLWPDYPNVSGIILGIA